MEWLSIALALCLGSTSVIEIVEKKPLPTPTCHETFLFWCRDKDQNIFFPRDREVFRDPIFSVEPNPPEKEATDDGSGGAGRGSDGSGIGGGVYPKNGTGEPPKIPENDLGKFES